VRPEAGAGQGARGARHSLPAVRGLSPRRARGPWGTASSVRGLESRSSEHPARWLSPPAFYMPRQAGGPQDRARPGRRPVSLSAGPRKPAQPGTPSGRRCGSVALPGCPPHRPRWAHTGAAPPGEYIKQIERRGSAPEAGSSGGATPLL